MPKRRLRQLELPLEFRRSAVFHAHIALGARTVAYTVQRSRRRSASFSLAIDERGLRIGVPWNATEKWIQTILRKHESWILRKLAEWQAHRPSLMHWQEGSVLMFLGEPLSLAFRPGLAHPIRDADRLLAGTHPSDGPAMAARAVTAWLREQALACFRARIAHYAPQLQVVTREVRLSEAKTRWGSCHAAGRILLSWRLIQMPLRLLDYVVVHELAHLREMNHSPRFWQTVAEVIPDYAARRKEMRSDACRYLIV